jgi:hypothetical protein
MEWEVHFRTWAVNENGSGSGLGDVCWVIGLHAAPCWTWDHCRVSNSPEDVPPSRHSDLACVAVGVQVAVMCVCVNSRCIGRLKWCVVMDHSGCPGSTMRCEM